MKNAEKFPLSGATLSDLHAYLKACERGCEGPFAKSFFSLSEVKNHVRERAPVYAKLANGFRVAEWLQANKYTCREAWVSGRHIRAWTRRLSHLDFLQAVKKHYVSAIKNSKKNLTP